MRRKIQKTHPKLYAVIKWGMLPLALYLVLFSAITWPWITYFDSHFMTDQGDGLQNVWNIWWINQAVTEYQQLPWYTNFLHHPFGVTLVGQTLNPFNGFVALVLLPFIPLHQAFNTMVVFSFVVAGLTAFWLCHYFSKRYIPSLIGGAVFTFSSYHLAHAFGHMQLISLEWIPLFTLLWWMFVKKPSYKLAIGSSFSLLLVLLCDYYYFLYSLMIALAIVIYFWYRKKLPSLRSPKTLKPLALFTGVSMVIIAPLPVALLYANATMEFSGSHPAKVFSTDLLTPFINGGFWRFHELTDWYWSRLPANIFESTVYLGVAVLVVLVVSVIKRKKLSKDVLFWQLLILFFAIMSLGPRLMVFGHSFEAIRMPYVLMEKIIPGMKLSGMPVRMMVIVTLGAAVVVAIVLASVKLHTNKGKLLLSLFIVVFIVDILPRSLPTTTSTYPAYVYKLKTLPSTGGVLDEAAKSEPLQLYHQTHYNKPMAFGYVSRLPNHIKDKNYKMWVYNQQDKLDKLCSEFQVRYLTAPIDKPRNTVFPIIYKDQQAIIYDLKNSPNC